MKLALAQCRMAALAWIASAMPLLLAAPAVVQAQTCSICDRNLIVNGGVEDAGQHAVGGLDTIDSAAKPQGWTVTGPMQAGRYDGEGFASDYGAPDRGERFFYGGPGVERSVAVQSVDLSAAQASIDASLVKFYLSGYLGKTGGIQNPGEISLAVVFTGLDETGTPVTLPVKISGPDEEEINNPGGLSLRAVTGFLPRGIRTAEVTLDLANADTDVNNLAADSLSLLLTVEPMDGVNLIVNGGAEAPWQAQSPVAGWNSHSDLGVGKYGEWGFPRFENTTDPVPEDAGGQLLYCPTTHSEPVAFQVVDVAGRKDIVDGGGVRYDFSGWLGGFQNDPDTAKLTVSFLGEAQPDGSQPELGAVELGPVIMQDRNGATGLWRRAADGGVPVGTRAIQVAVTFYRLRADPENISSFADNIALVLTVPGVVATVVNAASSLPGPVAPGEFVSIYGSNLGPAAGAVPAGMVKDVEGVKVLFGGVEAYQTYASAGQVNALVPYGVAGTTNLVVEYRGMRTAAFPLEVTDCAPGIFTQLYGEGQAWVVNQDGTFNSVQNPAAKGSYIAFFATGQGHVSPAGVDGGAIIPPDFPVPQAPVRVIVGGVEFEPVFAGLIYTGVLQVNAQIPNNVPSGGQVPLQLKVGDDASRTGVTLAVQ